MGPSHPSTLLALDNLANCLRRLGRTDDAALLLKPQPLRSNDRSSA